MKKKFNPDKYLLKVFQDSYHITRVLNSCLTREQLQNTHRWADQIMHSWGMNFSELAISTYYRYYKDSVDDAIRNMQIAYAERTDFFDGQDKQNEEQDKKKRIVVTGFQ